MVLEPIYESVFYPFSWGVPTPTVHPSRPECPPSWTKRPAHGLQVGDRGRHSGLFRRNRSSALATGSQKRIQDEKLLDLITTMLRCGIWEDGRVTYPSCGTPQGAVCSPSWPMCSCTSLTTGTAYLPRPARMGTFATSISNIVAKPRLGARSCLPAMLTIGSPSGMASRSRAEEIKAEIKTFLADELHLRLSEEKTLITHIDDGFDFLGIALQGHKRWSDGQWCFFSRVSERAIRRFRDAVKEITRYTLLDIIRRAVELTQGKAWSFWWD